MTRRGPRRRRDPDAMNQRFRTLDPASSWRTCPQSSTTPPRRWPSSTRASQISATPHRPSRGRGRRRGAAHKRYRWFLLAQHPGQRGGGHPQAPARPGLRSRGHTADPRGLRRSLRAASLRHRSQLDRRAAPGRSSPLIASGGPRTPHKDLSATSCCPRSLPPDGSHGPGHRPDRAAQNRLTARLLERPTSLRTLTARDANAGTSAREPQRQRQ